MVVNIYVHVPLHGYYTLAYLVSNHKKEWAYDIKNEFIERKGVEKCYFIF